MWLDLRVQKTRANIEQQFLKLLQEHSFQDISIKTLILECKINRSTFYRNYEDKYDLIDQIVQGVLEKFERSLRPGFIILSEPDERHLRPYFIPMLDFFTLFQPTLSVLRLRELPIDLFGDMHKMFSGKLLEELRAHYRLREQDMGTASYFARVISSNILTAIQWWHEESPQSSREDILKLITTSVTMGIFDSMEAQFSRL